MTTNNPLDPAGTSGGDTRDFGDLQVSAGRQSISVALELILYVIVVLAVLIASAVDEGFGASQAWFYVTLLTIGLFVNRGLAKINGRGGSNHSL